MRMLLTAWLVLILTVTARPADPESEAQPESPAAESVGGEPAAPDFGTDVRPILSNHCFACHGPDEEQRQAGLRLDQADGVAEVIFPGDPESSPLVERVQSDDEFMVMPPADFHKPLSDEQKATLERWVASGAEIEQHWAFITPTKADVSVPEKKTARASAAPSASTSIDRFINARLKESDLQPNDPAERRRLLRRVCLDLTGLPPTREQMREFLSDTSPQAYEKLVDRLLESPAFGEHMGRYWLDLVRFADTHGLHLDNYREMWPYRGWVIESFNRNRPFDQFIIEQLAGDLLPDATKAQRIASGYNRLNVTTNEGGSIYDEVFARNVIDRTDAFGTVFLGLTTGCAVCHDHKFDPITMQDYYSLSAFFNSLDGSAMDGNDEAPPPVIEVPTEEQQEQEAELVQVLEEIREEMSGPLPSVDRAQRRWERSLVESIEPATATLQPSKVSSEAGKPMELREDGSIELVGAPAAKDTTTIVAPLPAETDWQTLRLEALVDDPKGRVGASSNGNAVLSEITVETRDEPDGEWIPAPIHYALADVEQTGDQFAVRFAHDGKEDDSSGWAVAGHQQAGPRTAWFVMPPLVTEADEAQIRVRLKYQSKHAGHQFRRVRLSLSDRAPSVPEEQRVTLGPLHAAGPFPVENPNPGYGRKFASQGREFQVDEEFRYQDKTYQWQRREDLAPVEVGELPADPERASATLLHLNLKSPSAQKVTLLLGTSDGHVVYLNGAQVGTHRGPSALEPLAEQYELELNAGDNRLYIKVVNHRGRSRISYAFRSPAVAVPERLVALLEIPKEKRSEADRQALRTYYREVYCLHPDWLALVDQENGMRKSLEQLRDSFPTTLVWKETDEPRQAHILQRGQYDQPGEAVPRATPAFLPPMPEDAPRDRLGLARWLVSPDNPLTARVAVNRFWQQLFGTGIVKTSEDFGSQGEPPSHPELLDFLALEFQRSGWDVKRLMKTLVMTDAYRRSSRATEQMRAADPTNRLLARGPRPRLDAEVLRDQALALGGLLVESQGGPSVKPPQPAGLWSAVGYTRSNTANFEADSGSKVYRRSVYMFWKRTSPPPQLTTFDAPSRESCTVRRERTNTPLQALLMMNEQQYLDAARGLARRVLAQDGLSATDQPATDQPATDQHVRWLFETVTVRPPNEREAQELVGLYSDLVDHYRGKPDAAAELIGEPSAEAGAAERAAWTVVASTLLNLDEVVSK